MKNSLFTMNTNKIFKYSFIAVVSLGVSAGVAFACSPYFPIFFHTPQSLSELTFSEAGLGFSNIDNSDVVIPNNVDAYSLFPTYRKIIGKPLSYQTRKSLYYIEPDSVYSGSDTGNTIYPPTPLELWNKEKESVGMNINYKLNGACSNSTYRTAVSALKNRRNAYAKNDVFEWIKNQDKVFDLCARARNSSEDVIVRETKSSWFSSFRAYIKAKVAKLKSFFKREKVTALVVPRCDEDSCLFEAKYKGILQQDYEYQQAAVSFYRSDFDLAGKQFKVISETKDHPWRAYATYSLGRVYLQLGDELNRQEEYDKKATEQFRALINGRDLKALSPDDLAMLRDNAQEAISRMRYKNDWEILEKTDSPQIIKIVLDELYATNGETLKNSPYTQWLYSWTGTTTEALLIAKDNYKKTRQDVWLVPLAKHIKKTDPMFSEVSTAIRNLPQTFPAYWTVQYYLIKSYIDAGDIKEAQKILAQLPETPSSWVWNYIEDLRMLTADNLTSMFRHSVRYSITTYYVSENRDSKKIQQIPMIDDKAKDIFSIIPIEKQADIFSADDVLPKDQTELARLTVFVRAILQKNFIVADKMARLISENNETIKTDLANYLKSKNIEEKKFTSALFMLRYPGVGLWLYDDAVVKVPLVVKSENNTYEDNLMDSSYQTISNYAYHRWDYCQPYKYIPSDTPGSDTDESIDVAEPKYEISFIDGVLSKEDQSLARSESKKMYVVPPNYFAEIILAYAKAHPSDARIPKALHNGVKMTKYSTCQNDKTSGYSKNMFKLLHNEYPNSKWAKQTPVYY